MYTYIYIYIIYPTTKDVSFALLSWGDIQVHGGVILRELWDLYNGDIIPPMLGGVFLNGFAGMLSSFHVLEVDETHWILWVD